MVKIGIVLGSGLGGFADELRGTSVTNYSEIGGMPIPSASGHAGRMIEGDLDGVPVVVLAGRAHLYEGYTPRDVTAGVRLLARMGVKTLILTNASGAIAEEISPGDLVLIRDHMNFQGVNPLTGPSPEFIDMTEAYSKRLRELALAQARSQGFEMLEAVYAAVPGPSYETPAEIRYLRAIGAGLVGMSTVLETLQARALQIDVLGISCATNKAAGLGGKLEHEHVLAVGRAAHARLTALLRGVVAELARMQ